MAKMNRVIGRAYTTRVSGSASLRGLLWVLAAMSFAGLVWVVKDPAACRLGSPAEFLLVLVLSLEGIVASKHLTQAQIDTTEATKTTKLQAFTEVLRQISDENVREARRWILTANLPEDGEFEVQQVTVEELNNVRRLAVTYDRVGFFVKSGLFPIEDEFFAWHGEEIAKLWKRIRKLIAHVQETEGRRGYGQYFKYLGEDWCTQMSSRAKRNV